jgi:hypothetical protein
MKFTALRNRLDKLAAQIPAGPVKVHIYGGIKPEDCKPAAPAPIASEPPAQKAGPSPQDAHRRVSSARPSHSPEPPEGPAAGWEAAWWQAQQRRRS